mmetsp:Transcript_6895/g.15238  ORF Transcript_6895/g.15238 Transcript_6895/m.15238 type:complete len:214 (-) Transcript_6895:895-1536(-)
MTHWHRHRRPHIANTTFQCLGAMQRMRRHPYHIPRLFGPLTQCRAQSMRTFRRSFAIVDIDQFNTHAFIQGGWTNVRMGQLMSLWAGAKPHFGNVKIEGFACRTKEGFDGGNVGCGEETGLVECLEGFVVLRWCKWRILWIALNLLHLLWLLRVLWRMHHVHRLAQPTQRRRNHRWRRRRDGTGVGTKGAFSRVRRGLSRIGRAFGKDRGFVG